jgi:phage shock protein E
MLFIKKYWIVLAGILLGGVAGYLYYALVGCSSGTCSITSKLINSSLYGALLGGLLASSLFSNNTKKTKKDDTTN